MTWITKHTDRWCHEQGGHPDLHSHFLETILQYLMALCHAQPIELNLYSILSIFGSGLNSPSPLSIVTKWVYLIKMTYNLIFTYPHSKGSLSFVPYPIFLNKFRGDVSCSLMMATTTAMVPFIHISSTCCVCLVKTQDDMPMLQCCTDCVSTFLWCLQFLSWQE